MAADSCSVVIKDLNKVETKLMEWREKSLGEISSLKEDVDNLIHRLQNPEPEEPAVTLTDVKAVYLDMRRAVNDSSQSHKKYHSEVSKIGKTIDKNFVADFSSTSKDEVFTGERRGLLNQCIHDHLIRQSRIDLSQVFSKEAGLEDCLINAAYMKINAVMEELKVHNAQPAVEYLRASTATEKVPSLELRYLRFKLNRLELLKGSGPDPLELIAGLKSFFAYSDCQFWPKERNRLAGAIAYRKRLSESPYSDLVSDTAWEEVRQEFLRIACQLEDLALDSPLATCIYAGCVALPSILDMSVAIERNSKAVGTDKSELMTDIELGDRCLYHSSFACPILRRESASMPVRLRCGHVISREAHDSLRTGTRLKCPYCPDEAPGSEITPLWF